MKRLIFSAFIVAIFLASTTVLRANPRVQSSGEDLDRIEPVAPQQEPAPVQEPRVKPAEDTAKCNDDQQGKIELDIDIALSRQYGETVTDENGTFYHVWGMTFFEPKVYPPEYWGVFPLYFFGTEVGVTVEVENKSPGNKAKLLRLITECYCLRTDGSNGAQLLAPQEKNIVLRNRETKVVDASFVAGYVPGAESGLDRFLLKALKPSQNGDCDGDAEGSIAGGININPNNSSDNEFTLTLPDESTITRDNLHEDYPGYVGPATCIHVKPKGNGNQNGLIVNGQPYLMLNANTYDITSDSMTVNLYNDLVNSCGKAMGRWWIGVTAGDAVIICTPAGDGADLIMTKEAIFCPPEFDGEVMKVLDAVLNR